MMTELIWQTQSFQMKTVSVSLSAACRSLKCVYSAPSLVGCSNSMHFIEIEPHICWRLSPLTHWMPSLKLKTDQTETLAILMFIGNLVTFVALLSLFTLLAPCVKTGLSFSAVQTLLTKNNHNSVFRCMFSTHFASLDDQWLARNLNILEKALNGAVIRLVTNCYVAPSLSSQQGVLCLVSKCTALANGSLMPVDIGPQRLIPHIMPLKVVHLPNCWLLLAALSC